MCDGRHWWKGKEQQALRDMIKQRYPNYTRARRRKKYKQILNWILSAHQVHRFHDTILTLEEEVLFVHLCSYTQDSHALIPHHIGNQFYREETVEYNAFGWYIPCIPFIEMFNFLISLCLC